MVWEIVYKSPLLTIRATADQLERAVASIESDAQAAQLVGQLILQTDSKRINTEPLLRRIWDSPHAKVRTLRAAIAALRSTKKTDPHSAGIYSRVVLAITETPAHLDHLNISEWSVLARFCCSTQQKIPVSDERAFIKASTGFFYALRSLLDRPSLVDARVLPEILVTISTFTAEIETSSSPYIMGCLWRIYALCWLENPELAAECDSVFRKLLEFAPFRSELVTVEALIYLSISELNDIESKTIGSLTSEFSIPSEDIIFFPEKQSANGWFQQPFFKARSMATNSPWLASAAGANVLLHSQEPLAKRKVHRLLERALDINQGLGIQFLCFLDNLTLSSHDVRQLLDLLCFGASDLWILVLISIHGLDDLEQADLMRVWRACCDRLSTQTSTAACYCLSRCIQKFLTIPETPLVDLLLALVAQFETTPSAVPSPAFSSGSLVLYSTLSGLQILDQRFQAQKVRLDNWMARSLAYILSDKTSKLAPELVASLLGETFLSVRQGYLAEVDKALSWFLRAESALRLSGVTESQTDSQSQLSQSLQHGQESLSQSLQSLPESQDAGRAEGKSLVDKSKLSGALTCVPARDKAFMWYYLCHAVGIAAEFPFQEPLDMFKEDVEALVAYMNMQSQYSLGPQTVNALRELKLEWPRSDPLFHRAVFNLDPPQLETALDFVDAAPREPKVDQLIFIGKTVLASYTYQRDVGVLEKIMIAINSSTSKQAQDLYSYLFGIVKSHSRFSPLRPLFAQYVRSMSDLAELIETSSEALTLNLLQYIRFTDSLDGTSTTELARLLGAAKVHPARIRTQIYVALAIHGGDLGMVLAHVAQDSDSGALQQISKHFALSPDELLYRVCHRVFTYFESLDDFPFAFFGVKSVDRYAFRLPASLYADWPAETALFASRWLRNEYGNSNRKLASMKTKFDAAIYLHYTESLALQSSEWQGFPAPVNPNELVELQTLEPPSESVAVFVVEEILKKACELSPSTWKYLAIRQAYQVYSASKSPKVLTTFLRGMIALTNDVLLDVAVHVFRLCAAEADASALVDTFCAAPREFQNQVVADLEPLVNHPEINFLLELTQNPDESTINAVLSGRFKPSTLPFTLHRYFYSCIIDYIATHEPLVDSGSKTGSLLLKWQQKYRAETNPEFDSWAGRLLCDGEPEIVAAASSPDPMRSLIKCLRQVCDNGDYNTMRYLLPYLSRVGDLDIVQEMFPEIERYVLSEELWFDRLTCTDADPESIEEQAAYLFDSISANPMGEAFRHIPGLSLQVVPYLYQMADYEERAQILDTLKAYPEDGAVKWRLILDIFMTKYYEEPPSTEWLGVLIDYSYQLNQFDLAMMFLELQWSRRHHYDEVQYASIAKSIDDPDLSAGIKPSLSLKSVAQKLDKWPRLGYDLMRYELGHEKTLPNALRDVGIFRLAEKVDMPDLFDYTTAWKLQQWDLPEPARPTTEAEILFTLFKHPQVDVGKGFGMAWRSIVEGSASLGTLKTLSDLQKLEDRQLVNLPATSASEDCRQGRELLLSRSGNTALLLKELSNTCSWLRETGNTNRALEYSLRLETQAKDQPPAATLLSMIQSAETAWVLGDQSTAIAMLRQVTMDSSFFDPQDPKMYTVSQVYCRLAEMSAAARNERDEGILKTYLEPAVSHTSTSDMDTMSSVFHAFAKFCDEKYTDPALESEINEAARMVSSKKAQVKQLSDRSQWQDASRSEQKRAEHLLAKESLLYETEKREHHRLVKKRMALLKRGVLCYLRSLETGDSFDAHDGCRFMALWLANSTSDDINKIVAEEAPQLPTRKVVPWMNQLASCLLDDGSLFQTALKRLLAQVCIEHPYHTLWYILSLCQTSKGTTDVKALARQAAGVRFWKQNLSKSSRVDPKLLAAYSAFATNIIMLADEKVPSDQKRTFGFTKLKAAARKWWTTTLPELQLPVPTATIPLSGSYDFSTIPIIASVRDSIAIANGLSAPKIVKVVDSQGRQHRMLIKGSGDDLRQDAIMEQVFAQANVFFTSSSAARRRDLAIRSYNVVHLGPNAGVIEFVTNTRSLNDIVDPLHKEYDDKGWTSSRARELMRKAVPKGREGRIKAFEDVCSHIHPVLRLFFFNTFKDPREWLKARTQYARSSAAISIVGYILGLGDRHCNNILLDVGTGDVVHIDLGIAFDQGKLLRVPETVPFRLSRDIVDGLGATGIQGVFSRCAEITLELLREQRDGILTILEVLRYDPLYQWTVSPLRSRAVQAPSAVGASVAPQPLAPPGPHAVTDGGEADRALRGVRQKLSDGLSAEATVRVLCRQAASVENLGLLFEGWSPFY